MFSLQPRFGNARADPLFRHPCLVRRLRSRSAPPRRARRDATRGRNEAESGDERAGVKSVY
jgi:hypothetical protein